MTTARKPTKQECIDAFANAYVEDLLASAEMTPEAVAAASYGVRSGRFTLAEMTERIRADREQTRKEAS